MKEKGILLPIYSLPSKYGIGDFGYEAYEFIDILSENGIKYWEILPINACNRLPYSPISYYALEEDFISLDKLKSSGLIGNPEERPITDRAVYDNFKIKYYKEAYANFKKNDKYDRFITHKEMRQYAEYMNKTEGEDVEYYLFLQFILNRQWIELKRYANAKNVYIIGDLPFYPVFDSVETIYYPKYYEIKDKKYTFEAGTPPDYYNNNGQKWNAPVYNVENIKKDNYEYIVHRFRYQLKLFDKLRVDYFRGYDSFFRIPFGLTGKDGEYTDGFSYGFFDELFKYKNINPDDLIVEDLGDIRAETERLREHYGFTRQKILQFSLDLNNSFDIDNDDENVLAFPGNHDCQTLYGWYKSLSDEHKENVKKFLRNNECNDININIGMMQYFNKSKSKIDVFTVQDILGLDDSARINLPGVDRAENWSWKLVDFKSLREEIKNFK
ncbi:MAG: 4-alpha-glucanotransferase [Clostridia bacterium]|nr:4-alpha-glucanotransferase [Clostridia bacterium]